MEKTVIVGMATNRDGEGYVSKIGEWEGIEDIEIRTGHYAKDIVITFYVKQEKEED